MRWQTNGLHTTPTEVFNWRIFSFAIITTLGLQILSFAMIMVTASKERITRIDKKGRFKVAYQKK
jgi:heme/copper-type cytochrome/quinol oxidase subunit 1